MFWVGLVSLDLPVPRVCIFTNLSPPVRKQLSRFSIQSTQMCTSPEEYKVALQEIDDYPRTRSDKTDKSKITRLFANIADEHKSEAYAHFLHAIDVLMDRQNLCPDLEICTLASLVTGLPLAHLKDVLSVKCSASLYAQISKIKIRALRAFNMAEYLDKVPGEVSYDVLRDIANSSHANAVNVIDYIVALKEPSKSALQLLGEVVGRLNEMNPGLLEKQRAAINEKIPRDVNIFISAAQGEDIETCEAKMRSVEISTIEKWISELRDDIPNLTESRKWRLSAVLANVAKHFLIYDVSTQIMSLSIDIDIMLSQPRPNLFKKLQYMVALMDIHPQNDFTSLLKGFQLSFVLQDMKPTECYSDKQLVAYGTISAMLFREKRRISLLVQLLKSSTDDVSEISRLIIIVMSICERPPALPLEDMEALMKLAVPNRPTEVYTELEHAYASLTRRVYDRERLAKIAEGSPNDTIFAIMARTSPSVTEAYQWCEKFTTGSSAVKAVLYELGFIDLAANLGISFDVFNKTVPIHALHDMIYNSATNAAAVIDHLVISWSIMKNAGCHFDASRLLWTALKKTHEVYGIESVRCLALRKVYIEYQTTFKRTALLKHSYLTARDEMDRVTPPSISKAVDMFAQRVLDIYTEPPKQFTVFFEEYSNMWEAAKTDPTLNLLSECVVSSSPMVESPQVKPNAKFVAPFRKLFPLMRAIKRAKCNWQETMRFSEAIQWMRVISGSIFCEESGLHRDPNYLPSAVQGLPLYSDREYHGRFPCDIPKFGENIASPYNTMCISLNFDDENQLWLTRHDGIHDTITVRLPAQRNVDCISPAYNINYMEAINQIDSIITKSIERSAVQLEPRQFWKLQVAHDNELRALIENMEESWLGGFVGLTSTESLDADEELVASVSRVFDTAIKQCSNNVYNRRRQRRTPGGDSVKLTSWVVTLLLRQAMSKPSYKVKDLIHSVLDNIKFQGVAFNPEELDVNQIITDIQRVSYHRYRKNKASTAPPHVPRQRANILLVCDRKAANIPWEIFPMFRNKVVTRALSLYQIHEWLHYPETVSRKVSYLVNPNKDLPPTYKDFLTDFKIRGWKGTEDKPPEEPVLLQQLKSSHSFVYIGHGAGRTAMRGSSIRKLYHTTSSVYLLGCGSVQVHNWQEDDDALMEHSVRGSTMVMGTLWAVKDKDFNRYSKELLSRVFDEKEPVGQALLSARAGCLLPCLTAGAPVIYGLPDTIFPQQ